MRHQLSAIGKSNLLDRSDLETETIAPQTISQNVLHIAQLWHGLLPAEWRPPEEIRHAIVPTRYLGPPPIEDLDGTIAILEDFANATDGLLIVTLEKLRRIPIDEKLVSRPTIAILERIIDSDRAQEIRWSAAIVLGMMDPHHPHSAKAWGQIIELDGHQLGLSIAAIPLPLNLSAITGVPFPHFRWDRIELTKSRTN